MKSCNLLFADVRGALERDLKSLAKLGSIEFHPQTVSFTAKAPPQLKERAAASAANPPLGVFLSSR